MDLEEGVAMDLEVVRVARGGVAMRLNMAGVYEYRNCEKLYL